VWQDRWGQAASADGGGGGALSLSMGEERASAARSGETTALQGRGGEERSVHYYETTIASMITRSYP
jgi:hypothetical protein